jgi:hypothetical protein
MSFFLSFCLSFCPYFLKIAKKYIQRPDMIYWAQPVYIPGAGNASRLEQVGGQMDIKTKETKELKDKLIPGHTAGSIKRVKDLPGKALTNHDINIISTGGQQRVLKGDPQGQVVQEGGGHAVEQADQLQVQGPLGGGEQRGEGVDVHGGLHEQPGDVGQDHQQLLQHDGARGDHGDGQPGELLHRDGAQAGTQG